MNEAKQVLVPSFFKSMQCLVLGLFALPSEKAPK